MALIPPETIYDVKMPDLQIICEKQTKNSQGSDGRCQITDHHHQLSIVTVYKHTCQGYEQ